MGKVEIKKINHYSVEDLIDGVGLSRHPFSSRLDLWLGADITFSALEMLVLEEKRTELIEEVDTWNEQELIVSFIAHVFDIAKIKVADKVKTFYNRPLNGKIGDHEVSVVVDCLVATPSKSGRPQKPYFFLEEFKKTKGDRHDPEGQMLTAMILAQQANNDQKPIYGAWLQGRNWTFTMLENKEYHISKQYDATEMKDLLGIVAALRGLKGIVMG